ncbi:outer membrane beta-barrel protein [uncultured Bacteroides sp.]|uniref:outer membrane beta-barrel protein n=1 Tax=uncultured Bacteroides sp. TaxID=162156 RepID=UPI0023CF8DBF|nr:outer membrane beta-barrel protein [uncultured Bacteroides sp.]MDE5702955.1 porin family protein [Bacteroides sp.]MDE6172524.1 porin family protein [Bacteroides sp.]
MRKLALFVCLLVATVAARAQFEKGKWIVNPSISGLELSHNTGTDKTSFGIEAKGGAFLLDNVALLVHAGANWNAEKSNADIYTLGVGGRYYFSKVGIYLGADVNVDRWDWGEIDDTKFSFGAEAGYAFFLSRTVTIEPAVFWNVNSDRSKFGLKVGFGFYF